MAPNLAEFVLDDQGPTQKLVDGDVVVLKNGGSVTVSQKDGIVSASLNDGAPIRYLPEGTIISKVPTIGRKLRPEYLTTNHTWSNPKKS